MPTDMAPWSFRSMFAAKLPDAAELCGRRENADP